MFSHLGKIKNSLHITKVPRERLDHVHMQSEEPRKLRWALYLRENGAVRGLIRPVDRWGQSLENLGPQTWRTGAVEENGTERTGSQDDQESCYTRVIFSVLVVTDMLELSTRSVGIFRTAALACLLLSPSSLGRRHRSIAMSWPQHAYNAKSGHSALDTYRAPLPHTHIHTLSPLCRET